MKLLGRESGEIPGGTRVPAVTGRRLPDLVLGLLLFVVVLFGSFFVVSFLGIKAYVAEHPELELE